MPRASKRQKQKENIALIGAGTLATSLARALHARGYVIPEIATRRNPQSIRRARALAKRAQSSATTIEKAELTADLIWICVPDDAIEGVAEQIASGHDWAGRIAVHSSGALSSDALTVLKQRGAEVASAHPLMTFVTSSRADMSGVPFAIEGSPKASALVASIVQQLGAQPFPIAKEKKPAYHAFGFFSSPAIVALLSAAIDVGKLAGLDATRARALMEPIVQQTIENCFSSSPQQAFSGPVRRGDLETIRKHLAVLRHAPNLLEVYRSLVRVALSDLPSAKTEQIEVLIKLP